MATDDPSDQPLGFNIDIGDILRDVTAPRKRTTTRRKTTSRSTASNDMDAAMRRAVRAELKDVERALRELATEVVRLRRANEDLAEKVARLTRR
ncbi:MAG: hypothetical protein AB1627_12555 [Chloroflexota bacterium]